jgi:sn-glycerol 3-phosphate transport system permease protein
MRKRVIFNNQILPYVLLAPQVAITLVFFIWPAFEAIWQSLFIQNAFGTSVQFVGLDNFEDILGDTNYLGSFQVTVVFAVLVTILSMGPALVLAVMADRHIRGATAYKTLIIWPYAIAPAVAAVLWLFIFHPAVGSIGRLFRTVGIDWNYSLNSAQALGLVIFAAAWKQVSYNFLFFLAGLQSIPKSVLEAASIDGASATRRFWTIIVPLLSPTTFFLLVVNIVYAFFETFGVIDALTKGGPGSSTTTLIYRAYMDRNNFGTASAQSVILMAIVIGLTVVQFRYVERRVHY